MAAESWVNTGSGNGLLPDGTKPLPEPMLIYLQFSPVTCICGQFHIWNLYHHSLKLGWKLLIYDFVPISQGSKSLLTLHRTYRQFLIVMSIMRTILNVTLQCRHNGWDCVSNHQPPDCLLNCSFRRRSKKISRLRVTGLCVGNSPVINNAENVSVWWRHRDLWNCIETTLSSKDKFRIKYFWFSLVPFYEIVS